MELTNKDFSNFKDRLGFTNDDIAAIIDIKPGSVKNQVGLTKERIPTWARAMLFMERKNKTNNTKLNHLKKGLLLIEDKLNPLEMGSDYSGIGWLEKHLCRLGRKEGGSVTIRRRIKGIKIK